MLENLIGRGQDDSNGRDKVGLGTVRRPVIGLALGGGAARGFAHIGILRTLIANGIVPDVVVGTSIGAVVGGAYAAGHLDTLEEWARSLQPRNILGYLDIRLNGSGLIGGDKLAAQLEAAIGQTLIEDLPIKFAAVATEVRTGHEIWLTHGRMVEAMRASYALPGIFSPVLVGDRWLVDGALVNPVPVSAARALRRGDRHRRQPFQRHIRPFDDDLFPRRRQPRSRGGHAGRADRARRRRNAASANSSRLNGP